MLQMPYIRYRYDRLPLDFLAVASDEPPIRPRLIALYKMCFDWLIESKHGSISCRVWDIQRRKMPWPWNRGQRSLNFLGTDTYRSATHDFLLTFHSNHGPISHRFRNRRRYQSKLAKFSHQSVLYAHTDGLPLELGIGARGQKLEWWGCR